MEKKFVSVVIYLHNSQNQIKDFLQTIVPTIQDMFEHYEFICVDDACEDDTLQILKLYANSAGIDEKVSIVHMGFYQGLESAMNAGRDAAIGDFTFEFDDVYVDYDIDVIGEAYEYVQSDSDIVSVARDGKETLSSKLFYRVFNRYSKSVYDIGSETFRILSRRAINRIKAQAVYIPYRKAMYANCGLKKSTYKYIPTKSIEGLGQKHNFSLERGGLAIDSFIFFTNVVERISTFISIFFLLVTVGTLIYTLVDYFIEDSLVGGWASLMTFVSLGFFGVFVMLTLLLKYMSVVLNLIFKKQRYLVADIEKVV